MFQNAYRLCDVDDLITNTLGGIIGYVIVRVVEKCIPALPAIERFDWVTNKIIAEVVVKQYKKIENGVADGYKKLKTGIFEMLH